MRVRAFSAIVLALGVLVVPAFAGSAGAAEDPATALGRVFMPNPVVTLRDQSLTDQKDRDYAALAGAYQVVTLTNLDGSGYLHGDFAYVGGTKNDAYSATGEFLYGRSHTWFEQVMAYKAITDAQRYIQSLGFADINNEPQDVRVAQYGGDNSFYDSAKDTLTFGKGGVDDGEDMDVIWHEYGHAIQDDIVPGFGITHDGNSIGEGFSDYWAFTMGVPVSGGYEAACIADWDAVSYTSTEPHCLRRVDLDLTVADQTGRIHFDGQIWSRALHDIHTALGRETADRIILQSHFVMGVDPSFAEAALATVETAQELAGNGAAVKVRRAFEDRGIL